MFETFSTLIRVRSNAHNLMGCWLFSLFSAYLVSPCSLVVVSVPVCVVILAEVAVGVKSLCEARHESVTIFCQGLGK